MRSTTGVVPLSLLSLLSSSIAAAFDATTTVVIGWFNSSSRHGFRRTARSLGWIVIVVIVVARTASRQTRMAAAAAVVVTPSPCRRPLRRPLGSACSRGNACGQRSSRVDAHGTEEEMFETPRRFRSEDLVDGNNRGVSSSAVAALAAAAPSSKPNRQRSFSAHTTASAAATTASNEQCNDGTSAKGNEQIYTNSPTSIVDEVCPRRNPRLSSPRKIRTQEESHRQPRRNHKTQTQQRKPREATPSAATLFDGSRERELLLGDCRRTIRFLHQTEKMERREEKKRVATSDRSARDLQLQRRRRLQQAMQLTKLYHTMGLIHYQQGRYDTARHVLEHGLETLIADRANNAVPSTAAATAVATGKAATEEDARFDADYNSTHNNPRYFSFSDSLPPLPTLDEVAPYLSNHALLLAAELVVTQGKIFAAQGWWNDAKQSSGKVLQWSAFQRQRIFHGQPQTNNNSILEYWREWGPTTALSQVLFAECFQRENRPDIAMTYYQEALAVQRYVLGPIHVQVAETMSRIGNLQTTRGLLDLAEQCYHEALGVYRFHREEQEQHGCGSTRTMNTKTATMTATTGPSTANANHHAIASILADEATVLASLGWIYLLRRERDKAYWVTNQALQSTVHALGPLHRNVASLQYQMICIQNLGA